MKKMKLIVCLLFLSLVASIHAQELSRTIHLKVAGTLPDSITSSEKYQITHLTLTGDLNGTDIRFIREMAGVDVDGNLTKGKLEMLDMGGAKIVAGGAYYMYNSSYQTQNDVIGYSMFDRCSFSVFVMPNTINRIDIQAFSNCVNLVSVTIPGRVTEIASGAYIGCTSLKNLILSDGPKNLNITSFFYDSPIEKLYLGRNLEKGSLFYRNQTIVSVEIGNTVTYMADDMFYGCKNLKTAIIGNGVTSIGYSTFGECASLKEVSFVDGNKDLTLNNSNPFGGTALEKLYVGRNFYSGSMGTSYLKEIILGDSITYLCSRAFNSCKALTSISIPANIDSIGEGAFMHNTLLKELRFEDAEKDLKFENVGTFDLVSLEKIYLGRSLNGLRQFAGMRTLKEVAMSNKVTYLVEKAFEGCSGLSVITIPGSVDSIGRNAFSGCNLDSVFVQRAQPVELSASIGLENKSVYVNTGSEMAYRQSPFWNRSVIKGVDEKVLEVQVPTPGTLEAEIVKAGMRAPYVGKLKLSGSLDATDWEDIRVDMNCLYEIDLSGLDNEEIPSDIFNNRKLLLSAVLPANVKKIGDRLFANCTNLSGKIVFPATLSYIGKNAYEGTALSSVEWTGEDCTIGDAAFFNCQSLGSVKFSGTYSIGTDAFKKSGITALEPLTGLKSLAASAFDECLHLKGTVELAGIREIPQSAFANCSAIQSVVLPKNLHSIRILAFLGCSALESVSWSDSLEIVEMNAFSGCTKLKTVDLPESVTQLNNRAFADCIGLTEVKVHTKQPLSISAEVFEGANYSKCTLTVPKNSKDKYILAKGWQNFFNIEEGEYYGYNLLKMNCGQNGKVTLGDQEVAGGASKAFKLYEETSEPYELLFTPAMGYKVAAIFLDEKEVTAQLAENKYTIPALQKDASLTVTFELKQYTVGASVSQGEGTVTIDGQNAPSVSVAHASSVVFEFAPEGIYEVGRVELNGADVTGDVSDNRLIVSQVTEDLCLSVTFRKTTYVITTVVTGNGRLEINGDSAAEHMLEKGSTAQMLVFPDEGYELYLFKVEGYDLTESFKKAGKLITEMDRNLTIEVDFRELSAIRPVSGEIFRTEGDKLILSGLPAGELVNVYSGSGLLLRSVNVTEETLNVFLPAHQLYLVCIGKRCYKIKIN